MSTTSDLSKHTPGPWAVESIEDSYVDACWITYMAPGGHKIAKVAFFDSPNKANAKLIAAAPTLLEQNKKLQDFKEYVHKRLDDAGIEKDPEGEHSKHGCRIGDRLDIVLEQNKKMREALEKAVRAMQHGENANAYNILTDALK